MAELEAAIGDRCVILFGFRRVRRRKVGSFTGVFDHRAFSIADADMGLSTHQSEHEQSISKGGGSYGGGALPRELGVSHFTQPSSSRQSLGENLPRHSAAVRPIDCS